LIGEREQQSLGNAGYQVQSHLGIPDAIGFFSKPGLDLCQFGERLQFLMFIFGLFAFVDSEIRIRYRYRYRLNMSNMKSLSMSSTVLEEEEIEKETRRRRNWIQAKGNGRFLALVLVIPYLVCLIVGPVPSTIFIHSSLPQTPPPTRVPIYQQGEDAKSNLKL